ncbi:MAG TPA: glycoside hydrolase family 15 protein [Candidatus Aquilonibacter sp.]|nr:glycoside hydrolase family 15 protein [Candidatus Aquilonibacter sp.]
MPSAIEDYALIGDCETAALVAKDGSIDWLCVPRFDSPACFAALLGSVENGRWQLAPVAKAHVTRRYLPHSLILETTFRTSGGAVRVIDFMPPRARHPKIFRIVKGDRGSVQMSMDLVIRFDYGLTVPWVTQRSHGLLAIAGPNRIVLNTNVPVRGEGLHSVADFTMRKGQTVSFELTYGNSLDRPAAEGNPGSALRSTKKWWHDWVSYCCYTGPFSDDVERSLIVLKALIYGPTGGIIAAPTTSLPEVPKGSLNWDYRYCWLRDATFTILGFLHAGYRREADAWRQWLLRSVAGSPEQVQVLYGPTGERLLSEWEISWLEGHRKASPVRIGNAASEQLQLDLYGELADVFYQARAASKKDGANFDVEFALLEHLRRVWREPDHGIWEVRGKKRHFTHSKVMTWVAFDRTIRSAEKFKLKAPIDEWRQIRRDIHDDICRRGFNPRQGSFVQSYGSKEIDASLLLLPLVGFLPPNDPRIVGTVRAIEKKLIRKGFVMRYRANDSGVHSSGHEGAFLPCSFWLADYYELTGRQDAALKILKRLLKVQNDVGLLSEEYDVHNGHLLGNFPQALSHVALVNTIINLHTERGPARQRSGANRGKKQFL